MGPVDLKERTYDFQEQSRTTLEILAILVLSDVGDRGQELV